MTNYRTKAYKSWSSCLISGRGDLTDGINNIKQRAEDLFRPYPETRLTCKCSVCQDFLFHIETYKHVILMWICHLEDQTPLEHEWLTRKWLLIDSVRSDFS